METKQERKREVWVDWLRVAACFMVIVVHSTEPFYLGGDGSLILTRADLFWAAFFDSFVRSCVPLFVIASSYLQFPVHYPTGEFFRRRAVRILIPFVIWSLAYALFWGEPVQNLKGLLLNFNYAAGHLWFVYMLIGLYLLMPLLSPWAERVGRKELLLYLCICFATSLVPILRDLASGGGPIVIYDISGVPRQAEYPLWGEACWNSFGMFYYLSGFIGYLLLGLYLRRFGGRWSAAKTFTVAPLMFLAGFAITFGGFVRRALADAGGVFPVAGGVPLSVRWETTWTYCSIGVVLMATALILLFRRIGAGASADETAGTSAPAVTAPSRTSGFYRRVILPLSEAGYGIYLCHMFALAAFSGLWRDTLGIGTDGILGIWTTPVEIILTAVCTFVTVGAAATLGRKIPKAGRWIFG